MWAILKKPKKHQMRTGTVVVMITALRDIGAARAKRTRDILRLDNGLDLDRTGLRRAASL